MGRRRADGPSAILVEDHQIFREGVRDLLLAEGIAVAGEASTAADAVALAAELRPEVALVDIRLADASGIDATRRIRTVSPPTNVVVLTASTDERDVSAALAAGACGYLLKQSSPEQIASGVRAAADGGSPLSASVAALLLERLRATPAEPAAEDNARALTEREREVLALIVAGKDNAEIAEELVISHHTVKNHVSGVLAKLRVENRIQAAVHAVRRGLA